MTGFWLRRGTPIDVRRSVHDRWRAHVCATDTVFRPGTQLACLETSRWVFEQNGWFVRVSVPYLARTTIEGEDETLVSEDWHVGITGTREGLTPHQRAAVAEHLLQWLRYSLHCVLTFHHGGCVGADRDVHELIREVYGGVARIVVHPASDQPPHLCNWDDADELREPRRSLDRNTDIVNAVSRGSLLIACPQTEREEVRSGTWSTVRTARKLKRGVLLFLPNGKVDGTERK